jgi:hypothetical protein
MEIISVSGGYVYASIDIARRLSWQWAQNSYHGRISNDVRFGAWALSFFAMPVASVMLCTSGSKNWDKPPRSQRREAKKAERRAAYAELEKENKKMEKRLELYEGVG